MVLVVFLVSPVVHLDGKEDQTDHIEDAPGEIKKDLDIVINGRNTKPRVDMVDKVELVEMVEMVVLAEEVEEVDLVEEVDMAEEEEEVDWEEKVDLEKVSKLLLIREFLEKLVVKVLLVELVEMLVMVERDQLD